MGNVQNKSAIVKRTKGQKTSAVTKTKSVDRFEDTKEIAILKI